MRSTATPTWICRRRGILGADRSVLAEANGRKFIVDAVMVSGMLPTPPDRRARLPGGSFSRRPREANGIEAEGLRVHHAVRYPVVDPRRHVGSAERINSRARNNEICARWNAQHQVVTTIFAARMCTALFASVSLHAFDSVVASMTKETRSSSLS